MADVISSNPPAELDESLRVDVRVLGDLLGEVLRQQAGPDVYETVERIRDRVYSPWRASRYTSSREETGHYIHYT